VPFEIPLRTVSQIIADERRAVERTPDLEPGEVAVNVDELTPGELLKWFERHDENEVGVDSDGRRVDMLWWISAEPEAKRAIVGELLEEGYSIRRVVEELDWNPEAILLSDILPEAMRGALGVLGSDYGSAKTYAPLPGWTTRQLIARSLFSPRAINRWRPPELRLSDEEIAKIERELPSREARIQAYVAEQYDGGPEVAEALRAADRTGWDGEIGGDGDTEPDPSPRAPAGGRSMRFSADRGESIS
jgi:hypothetical protein